MKQKDGGRSAVAAAVAAAAAASTFTGDRRNSHKTHCDRRSRQQLPVHPFGCLSQGLRNPGEILSLDPLSRVTCSRGVASASGVTAAFDDASP